MDILKKQLRLYINKLSAEKQAIFNQNFNDLCSVYPFNEYEYTFSVLFTELGLSFDEYLEIRQEYIARNIYLHVFEISAPRSFGESWAQGNIKLLATEFKVPTKKIDPNYSGQYDFIYTNTDGNQVRIEVKASRAVDANNNVDPLYVKALGSDSELNFDMNFQQIKTKCCDVFVWVGVWRDTIKYWVLSSQEVRNNKYYSVGQHRGNVDEGQLHIKKDNIKEFEKYETTGRKLFDAVNQAHLRQINKNHL